MALAVYRNLLRSTRIAFRDDAPTLRIARLTARQAFEQHRGAIGEELERELTHAEEVAKILRENVVQGVAGGNGDYRFSMWTVNIRSCVKRDGLRAWQS